MPNNKGPFVRARGFWAGAIAIANTHHARNTSKNATVAAAPATIHPSVRPITQPVELIAATRTAMKVPMAAAAPKKSPILWMLRSSLLATALKYAGDLRKESRDRRACQNANSNTAPPHANAKAPAPAKR